MKICNLKTRKLKLSMHKYRLQRTFRQRNFSIILRHFKWLLIFGTMINFMSVCVSRKMYMVCSMENNIVKFFINLWIRKNCNGILYKIIWHYVMAQLKNTIVLVTIFFIFQHNPPFDPTHFLRRFTIASISRIHQELVSLWK